MAIFFFIRNKDHRSGEKNKSNCNVEEPEIPTTITSKIKNKIEIVVEWEKSKDAESYKVYRYIEDPLKGCNPVQVEEVIENIIEFTDLKDDNHWIRIRAVRGCAVSDFSDIIYVRLNSIKDDSIPKI